MKRMFSLIMAITMLMCAVGFTPISAHAQEYTYGDTNEFETKYNISYYQFEGSWDANYTKIQSVDELPNTSERYSKYDEEFFNNKFLLILNVGTAAYSGDSFRVVSLTENEESLTIDVDYISNEIGIEDWIPWSIMLEADKSQLNKEIKVRVGYDYSNVDYYAGGININSETLNPQSTPYIVKIDSAEQLESYVGIGKSKIIEQAKRWFSLNDYALFIQWVEPTEGRTREVKSIYFDLFNDNGQIIVKMPSFTPEGEYPTVVTPYCAVVPISSKLWDNEVVLEYDNKNNALEISTAEELKVFADSVNNGNTYEGETVTLTADIDLSSVCGENINGEEVSWIQIGTDEPFNGTFDGNGHTVSGLYIHSGQSNGAGLFGWCGESSQVLNLVVDGSVTVGYPSLDGWANPPSIISGIVGFSLGKIANCHNKAVITGIGNGAYAAGICGSGPCVIENCINTGVIVSEYNSEAIVAFGSGNGNDNCYYLEGTSVDGSCAEAKTAEQFASGEVAYLLGEPWGQKIGVDEYPVSGGDKVYYINGKYTNAPKRVVTVEPPTVNIESGEVPYGTKVTISPTNSNDFVYFVNGEQFIHSRLMNAGILTDAVITITEDTVLVVKSMIDVIEPDTEYVFPEATYTYTIGGSVVPPENHIHKICGDESCTDNHDDITWTAWDSTDTLPTEAGNYYLTKDVTLISRWQPHEEINLCLNGHIISVDDYTLWISGIITFTDCSDTIHKFSVADNGLWVPDEQNGTKLVTGGVLTGSNDDSDYAAIILPPAGTVSMYNINITGNREFIGPDGPGENGAVYIGGGTFNMYSGRIAGNIAMRDGGGVMIYTGTFNMYGGEISENIASDGGGVYNGTGTFNMYGGKISENTSKYGHAGGVWNIDTMTVGGTSVINDNIGGNLYVYEYDSEYPFGINNPLTDGAYIGITVDTAPTNGNPVDITGANDADYSKYFHSDDEIYKIVNGENNVIQLVYVNKIKPYMSRMFFNEDNIQSVKVTSLSQLKELVYEQCDYDNILDKYDEAFFNDKFLYLYRVDNGSSGNVYTINSVEDIENSINIEVQQKSEGATDDVVQWFLVLELDKNLYDRDINVNFIKIQGETYPYEITGLKLVNAAGEEIEYPKENTSFIVDVDITKISARNSKDYFIVAAYDTNGALISMNYIKADLSAGSDFSFGVNIPKSDTAIGSIKAFVWDALDGMTPLAESKCIECSAPPLTE